MKKWNEFYLSTVRIFWMVNLGFCIALVLLFNFIADSDVNEILLQCGIALVMTFVLVWILGGYKKIRADYQKRISKTQGD